MSKEAIEAIEAMRRQLSVRVSLATSDHYFDSPPKLNVTVQLLYCGEVISEHQDAVEALR